ncbi:unnamed protein product [Danaus chrysippus]|nr:unnamed protein product [Danaus chrysippus]CAG9574831.1 unnamed protein product [Danaus chrysippus]
MLRLQKLEYHTYALPEERRLTVVIKGLPAEIPIDEIKEDLKSQNLPVLEVHRMHKPNKKPFDMVLVPLSLTREGKEIFNIASVCQLFGLTIEPPLNRLAPGQCHS